MTYSELVQTYFERSNALQWYWTLYVIVIGGLLAFASLRKQPDRLTTAVVTILYLCFAYKNLDAIRDVTLQRFAILDLLKALPAGGNANLLTTLVAPAYEGIQIFHVACDVLTVIALWSMELRRRKAAAAQQPQQA
jgi:hypothetical protein